MYNDYYLQEISGKITTTNNTLSTIQATQIDIEAYLTSGDIYYQKLISQQKDIYNGLGLLTFVMVALLLLNFVGRCWK